MRSLLAALLLASGSAFAGEPQLLETRGTVLFDRGHEKVETWRVEIAETPAEQASGLMHRASMPPGTGMLFDFGTVRPVSMWMRNTLIPLDMVFVCPDGTIARVARAKPLDETVIPSGEPVRYVLEVNAGEAEAAGLERGKRLISGEGDRFDAPRAESDRCGR